jgi:hypothetical protein
MGDRFFAWPGRWYAASVIIYFRDGSISHRSLSEHAESMSAARRLIRAQIARDCKNHPFRKIEFESIDRES